jgi:chemotaxis protein CheD
MRGVLVNSISRTLPEPLPGFEGVNRYWDKRMNLAAAKILPGEFYVSNQGEMIVTVLGSCISACIRDKILGVGGMNHFMLPYKGEDADRWGNQVSEASRYGNWAMEYLINAILSQGGTRRNLEVKVFGGGQVLANMTDVGHNNIDFVTSYLAQEGLKIVAQDVGGIYPRKVLYFPDTGAVKMRKLKTMHNKTVEQREREYSRRIDVKPAAGEVELF